MIKHTFACFALLLSLFFFSGTDHVYASKNEIMIKKQESIRVKRNVMEKFLSPHGLVIIPVVKKPSTPPAKKGLVLDTDRFQRIHDMRPTFYYTEEEKHYNCSSLAEILDTSGHRIGSCREGFFKAILQQGSGRLVDGRTVNIVSKGRFRILPGSVLGITKTGYQVIPFHTLAVNPKIMPYGGIYYIPATKGIRLPDGKRHDGIWFAHDTGSAFKGKRDRMDMYVRDRTGRRLFEKNGIKSHNPLKIFRVDPDTAARVIRKYSGVLKKGF